MWRSFKRLWLPTSLSVTKIRFITSLFVLLAMVVLFRVYYRSDYENDRETLKLLRPNMTEADVLAVLGTPAGPSGQWEIGYSKDWQGRAGIITVDFNLDKRVVGWGYIEGDVSLQVPF